MTVAVLQEYTAQTQNTGLRIVTVVSTLLCCLQTTQTLTLELILRPILTLALT